MSNANNGTPRPLPLPASRRLQSRQSQEQTARIKQHLRTHRMLSDQPVVLSCLVIVNDEPITLAILVARWVTPWHAIDMALLAILGTFPQARRVYMAAGFTREAAARRVTGYAINDIARRTIEATPPANDPAVPPTGESPA